MSALQPWHWAFDGNIPEAPTAKQLMTTIEALVSVTRLTSIASPAIYVHTPDWAALQLIAESHISLHGRGAQAFVDVFSCRQFDVEAVGVALVDSLGGSWRSWQLRPMPDGLVVA